MKLTRCCVWAALLPLLRTCALAQALPVTDFGQIAANTGTPASQTLSFPFSNLRVQPVFSLQYGLDFKIATLNCNANWTACTVAILFSPKYPGLRQDAVVARDGAGNLLAAASVHGLGLGPQPAFSPGLFSKIPFTAQPNSVPSAVVADASGDIYVADSNNNVILRRTAGGSVTVVAGTVSSIGGNSGDGGPAASARLDFPSGLAVDGAGNLYIVDQGNSTIRRLNKATGTITTVAGNGSLGYAGDGGPAAAAKLNQPTAVAVDAAGNIYVAEFYDRIRKVTAATGIITTIAGNGAQGYTGDGGPAIAAALSTPMGLALDAAGNLFVSNFDSNTIRRVDALNGYITTVAGNGTQGYTGDGGPGASAELNGPRGIAVDPAGNLYIADSGNNVIRKVAAGTNAISTVAGNRTKPNQIQDNYPAASGSISVPSGIALDTAGSLYVQNMWGVSTIAATTTSVMFTPTPPGQISAAQTLTISNIGNQALSLAGLFISGNFVQQASGTSACSSSTVLPPGGDCLAYIAFTPAAAGILTGALVVTDNALNQPGAQQLITLLGPWAKAIPSTSSINFGSGTVGSSGGNQWVAISNPGNSPLAISSIAIVGANPGDFTTDASECPTSIPAQTICSLNLSFAPKSPGSKTASVVLTDNALDSPQTISVAGTGLAPANLVVSANSLTFGNQALETTSLPQTITLTNTGGESVLFTSLQPFGRDYSFAVQDNACFFEIPAGKTCTISIKFTPTASGASGGGLNLAFRSPPAAAKVISISGYGVNPVSFTGKPGDVRRTGDFDGDGQLDYAVWRPSNGTWYVIPSSHPQQPFIQQWGLPGDVPVAGDFDGDGKTDFAVWRPWNGTWYIMPTSNPAAPYTRQWGLPGDVPLAGDFDRDGKTDFTVWRPSTGTWYVLPSSNPAAPYIQQWGLPGDIPVTGDFDGDGRTDFAVWRPASGTWFIIPSSRPAAWYSQQWGLPGDIPITGDFDADGRTDLAVWRPGSGTWFVIPSAHPAAPYSQQWGLTGDIPAAADFDADGRTDLVVWRPANGTWYITPSSRLQAIRVQQWGWPGDSPL